MFLSVAVHLPVTDVQVFHFLSNEVGTNNFPVPKAICVCRGGFSVGFNYKSITLIENILCIEFIESSGLIYNMFAHNSVALRN